MSFVMYAHPFSSYSQKAKTAFYEKGVPFTEIVLDGGEEVMAEFTGLWPVGKFPMVVDDGEVVFDATAIIERLEARTPGAPNLIPSDALAAAEVRMWDRFFDNYVSYPQQRLVYRVLGREPDEGLDGAPWKAALDTAYEILDRRMDGREWACGDFSLADCAAAPALLYADWSHPIPKRCSNLWAYRDRLLARPSYARALDEARPYRHFFPLGAPEGRD